MLFLDIHVTTYNLGIRQFDLSIKVPDSWDASLPTYESPQLQIVWEDDLPFLITTSRGTPKVEVRTDFRRLGVPAVWFHGGRSATIRYVGMRVVGS